MKEPDGRNFWKDALERWNRLPSEEGAVTVVRGADRKRLTLRREGRVWHILKPSEIGGGARVIDVDLPSKAIMPAFANAHTHLDLTHVGPRPHDPADPDGFASWIRMVIANRATDAEAIRASVRDGLSRSLRGGVVAVGDIAGIGRIEPVEELRASPLAGVSFVEFFGLGERQQATSDAMRALAERGPVVAEGVRLGLQPHALYSAGAGVFKAAVAHHAAHAVALSTHLAESIEERDLLTNGRGPIRAFLEMMGMAWNEPNAPSPTGMFASRTRGERWLIAHANDVSDADIELLRVMDASVAFCARGHAYFGHMATLGAHRWRDLLAAGVRVCLGTDSVINLPDSQADRITPLDDARLLFCAHRTGDAAHDASLAKQLIDMITVAPAQALGIKTACHQMAPGPMLGLVAVEVGEIGDREPCIAALESDAPPELVAFSDKRSLERQGVLWAKNDA